MKKPMLAVLTVYEITLHVASSWKEARRMVRGWAKADFPSHRFTVRCSMRRTPADHPTQPNIRVLRACVIQRAA